MKTSNWISFKTRKWYNLSTKLQTVCLLMKSFQGHLKSKPINRQQVAGEMLATSTVHFMLENAWQKSNSYWIKSTCQKLNSTRLERDSQKTDLLIQIGLWSLVFGLWSLAIYCFWSFLFWIILIFELFISFSETWII